MGFLSKLFGKEDEGEKALREYMKSIWKIIDDEEYQISLLPQIVRESIRNGAAIDQLPDGVGLFGFQKENPIPVNGAVGELAYLSRLETVEGERLLFHRIGSIDRIDVFEAVTYSGSEWHLFYVDFYHPRRSRIAPLGFRIASEPRQFSGFHKFAQNFPYDFVEAKQATEDMLRLAYIPIGNVLSQIQQQVFVRPSAHKAKLDMITKMITSRSDM
jgi:hypothetical protein